MKVRTLPLVLFFCLALFGAAAESTAATFENIRVGRTRIKVEIAKTMEEQRRGLMFRKELGKDTGMLFIYPEETKLIFWMKNTLIPLDIGYFGSDGTLDEIKTMEVDPEGANDRTRRRYEAAKPGMYVLEMPKGWFAQKGIKPGMKLTFEKSKSPRQKKKTDN